VIQLQALAVGHALDVRCAGGGAVHSVFLHAVNLEVRGELWTLLAADRNDLPLGIRLAPAELDALGLHAGDRVDVRAGFVGAGSGSRRIVVDCRAAPRWIPAPHPVLAGGLAQRLRTAEAAAVHRAWHGSAGMADSVVSALHDPAALCRVLRGVVGCGTGSTPAGDDVLVGILAVLAVPHLARTGAAAAQSLRPCMLPLLPTTTDISAHMLRQAAAGLFARPVHELVSALIAERPQRLIEAVQKAVDCGATSGADLCMGLLSCATSFLTNHHQEAAA
jgi:hypothetical protein